MLSRVVAVTCTLKKRLGISKLWCALGIYFPKEAKCADPDEIPLLCLGLHCLPKY